MRPSLQLKIGQQLTMTPQLQQAIKLLQLSTLDLQQEIQEALDSNPLLEIDESGSDNEDRNADSYEEAYSAQVKEKKSGDGSEDSTPTSDEISTSEALEKNDIPEELSMDTTWDESFSAGISTSGIGSGAT